MNNFSSLPSSQTTFVYSIQCLSLGCLTMRRELFNKATIWLCNIETTSALLAPRNTLFTTTLAKKMPSFSDVTVIDFLCSKYVNTVNITVLSR